MLDIITIGDSTFDTFLVLEERTASCDIQKKERKLCLNYAEKICIEHTAQSVGGNAANVAVGCRLLGLKSSIITELGDDLSGHMIIQELERAKVNTDFAKISKNRATRYAIVLNYQAERTVLSSHTKRKYSFPIHIPKTKWIYYTSLGASFERLQDKLVLYLKKHSETNLAINPGSYQFRQGLKKIQALLPHTNILFVNKEEAEKLVGKKRDVKKILSSLHRRGVGMIVLTQSIDGSYVSDGTTIWHMPIYPIKPLAKTGAGDAYASGFLTAHILGHDIPTAMQWGTANAGHVIQAFGAQKGLANKSKILKMITQFERIKPQIV
jgi:sugar/nucleoside kinase (ribokinase family)